MGVIAVPLMALTIAPAQAVAIMLPILCVMDVLAVKQHYRQADIEQLKLMLPGAIIGVIIAGIFLSITPESGLKLLIGALSLLFCLQYVIQTNVAQKRSGKIRAWFWSILSGFSSTAIHAGGGQQVFICCHWD